MKIVLRITFGLVGLLVLVAGGALGYLNLAYPNVGPARAITVERTPERIERGKYLANYVAVCIDCHSDRDWNLYSGPVVLGTEGRGGFRFDEQLGFPGVFYSRNITPAALADWTDGEILRAFTCGVSRTGGPYFPVMPYLAYGRMAEDDAEAIVAYLRTLAPIENAVPESSPKFPVSFIARTFPREARPMRRPEPSEGPVYGEYMATIAGCFDCHTLYDLQAFAPIPGMEYAGGSEYLLGPMGTVRSANITPDPATGIGEWDREFFISRFKFYATPEARSSPVPVREMQTVMPWTMYASMTEEDLGAVYDYLRTVKPVSHKVEKFTPPARK